jgi:CheY-like chemotaxis protein
LVSYAALARALPPSLRATELPPLLIVGEDPRYRTSVAQVLRLAGHYMVLTADPRTALAMLRGGLEPGLCLLDGPVDPALAAELVARGDAGRDDSILLLEPSDRLMARPPFRTSLTLTKPVTDRELLAAVVSMSAGDQ